jgi:Protein of unknown function (DUF3105)
VARQKAKQPASADRRGRRETIEALRAQQRSSERRKTLMVVGGAGALGLVLVGTAAFFAVQESRNDPANRELSSFGVEAAAAGCDPVVTDETSGSSVHVGPGTEQADTTRVDYATVPPTSGAHFPNWADDFSRKFYTAADRPPMEALVHNLEHGYSILWYAEDATAEELETLEGLAERGSDEPATAGKFLVSAWDTSYGELPEGKRFALSHWGAEEGYRQLCADVSGAVVGDFVEAYPASNSPEPQGG